ncbi:hypothetical protein V6N12_006547 [Hibiscus sabdariffa]|uniref:Uncharacterized protein n=1 Tax=Hibiscus sabdariffa TaxID=183260 RepID=A0ABR2EZ58_9ROSI
MGDMHHSITRVALPVVAGAAKVCQQQVHNERTELAGQGDVQQPAGDHLGENATRASERSPSASGHGEFATTQLEQEEQVVSDSIPTAACEVPLEQVTEEVTQYEDQAAQDDAHESMADQGSDRFVNENVSEASFGGATTQDEETVDAQEDQQYGGRQTLRRGGFGSGVRVMATGDVDGKGERASVDGPTGKLKEMGEYEILMR